MRIAVILGLVLFGACAGDLNSGADDTDNCAVTISSTPAMVFAGPDSEVRLISSVTNASGTLGYLWSVTKNNNQVATEDAQSDGSEVTFIADQTGTYEVTLNVTPSSGSGCPQAHAMVNALMDSEFRNARLHIVPPLTAMGPVVDRPLQLHDGTDFDMGAVVLELSTMASGTVRNASGVGIPAYVQFYPLGMNGAMVEAFAGNTGAFSARLLIQPHDVIVIPAATNIAPERIETYSPMGTLATLTAPDTITGTVHQGATAIANARVQITIDGVPTTLGITAANGSFSVLGHHRANKDVTIEVTPAASSGLPRLAVTGKITTTGAIDVSYAGITLRNLGGVPVRRDGSALANRTVVIAGPVASTSTIAGLDADAYLRIPTTTDAGGNLPSVLAPSVSTLAAVTTVAPGDFAVGTIPAGTPAAIDAPPMTAIAATAQGGTTALSGATLDLIPQGALAAANAPALQLVADATGRVTGTIPTGATYDVRWTDPQGRVGPRVDHDQTSIAGTYPMPPAIYVSGDVTITGSSNPVVGASVQVLCDGCSGLDRTRPIAEVVTDSHGSFRLAVPDPATM